jgi:hypothetical protein
MHLRVLSITRKSDASQFAWCELYFTPEKPSARWTRHPQEKLAPLWLPVIYQSTNSEWISNPKSATTEPALEVALVSCLPGYMGIHTKSPRCLQ